MATRTTMPAIVILVRKHNELPNVRTATALLQRLFHFTPGN